MELAAAVITDRHPVADITTDYREAAQPSNLISLGQAGLPDPSEHLDKVSGMLVEWCDDMARHAPRPGYCPSLWSATLLYITSQNLN